MDRGERLHIRRFDRHDVLDVLQDAIDQQKRLFDQSEPASLEEVRRDDGVGDAGLVFEAEEDEPK